MRSPLFLTTALALSLLAAVAQAGTPARKTKVHLDKAAALEEVFPGAERVVELRHVLSTGEMERIESLMGRRLEEGGFYLYAGLRGGQPVGYAAIVSQIGKVKPITHIVGVTPEGTVGSVAVMIYRESHGAEIADTRFMDQYRGLGLEDPIRIDQDIINIAGATLSGHAICRGVRKALAVVQEVFLQRDLAARMDLLADAEDVTPNALLEAATPQTDNHTSGMRLQREVMGTICTVEAFPVEGVLEGEALASALEAALDEVSRWDGVLSNWQPDTALARLNDQPAGALIEVDPDLMAWFDDAASWHQATSGHFDPAVGSLVQAWGLMTATPGRPADAELARALADSGLAHFVRSDDGRGITRTRAGALLDPGASGKGFALDQAADVLRRHGVERALLSFRSTLLALGPPPGRAAWSVPIAHDGARDLVQSVELADGALSVSGGGLRPFDDGGIARGHVLDPRTGVPVTASRLAWVQHPSAAASDALATALLVAGPTLPGVPMAVGGWMQKAAVAPTGWPYHP